MSSHHVRATSRALGSWHKLGLALPSNAVAPQSLADVLEEGRGEDKKALVGPAAGALFWCIANFKGA